MFRMINDFVEYHPGCTRYGARRGDFSTRSSEYKSVHFATEEGYFKEFGYEGAAEHIIAEHRKFDETLAKYEGAAYADDTTGLGFRVGGFS
jgi:hemerythrin